MAGAGLLLLPLARFWSGHDDYRYGWGVPALAAYLFYERWTGRPEPHWAGPRRCGRGGVIAALVVWGILLLGVRLILETEPASRPVLWLDASLLAGALAAWTGLLGGRPWLRHFAFPLAFLLAGVPWIFGCEFFVTQELMRLNAEAVAGTLDLLGFPARAAGNTIVLATGQLGVSEACSGIRSLQATLMMSLFFGEFYRYGARGRVALVAAGAGLALAANFARMLYLAWRGAREGVAAVEAIHDSAGWSILAGTVLALWLGCLLTRRAEIPRRIVAPRRSDESARRLARTWAAGVVAITLLAEATTQGWYGWRERMAPRAPAWSVSWPTLAAGDSAVPVEEKRRLHAADASTASWRDAAGNRWTGLWIRYEANAEGKVVFESHNPGLCLTAAGWREISAGRPFVVRAERIFLPVESSVFQVGRETAHVYWIAYVDRGVRAGMDTTPGLYGHSLAALAQGHWPWLTDVWAGCRGVRAETLELALTGPVDAAQADDDLRRLLPLLIRPDSPGLPSLAVGTH